MTKKVAPEDSEIIQLLRKGKTSSREKAFRKIYRSFYQKGVGYVIKQGANETQAKTVFNIGLMRLEQKVVVPDFELQSSLSSYLIGILRLVWMEERRKVMSYSEIDEQVSGKLLVESSDQKEQVHQQLLQCLQRLGPDCKRILYFKYWLNLDMNQIAEKMGFSGKNAHFSAANKKNRCMKKLVVECDEKQFLDI
ncbi:MAG: sigma-70 family RNA polymerase sigma factor [Bacteroidota bacterium]